VEEAGAGPTGEQLARVRIAVAEEELASEKYMAYLGEKSRSQTGYISSSGIRSW
jgi:hypothetical protein